MLCALPHKMTAAVVRTSLSALLKDAAALEKVNSPKFLSRAINTYLALSHSKKVNRV